MKRGKPSERLLVMLHGPRPPMDFVDNGCSASLDWWFHWACRIHDYEYHLCRTRYWGLGMDIWKRHRKRADRNLRENIKILSCTVNENYKITIPTWISFRVWWVYSRYFAVRVFGGRHARPG